MIVKYFFIGLFVSITMVPKYLILGIKKIFNKKQKIESPTIPKNINFSSKIIFSLLILTYLSCVFIFVRWYTQGLKIKYLTEDIISSTEIVEKVEIIPPEDDTSDEPDDSDTDTDNNTNSGTYYPNDYWDYINVPYIDVDFSSLLAKNNETVAWIKVEGTKVNYPVVQTTNNDFYLSHDFQKNYNKAGWIFSDYRNDFTNLKKNSIIYGHNMNNKTMFGSLPDAVLNSSWQSNSNNHFIKVSTPTANSVWKIFSVYTITPEVYYLKTVFSDEEFQEFINTLKNRSIYNFNTDVTINDKILTLSTCDNTGQKRVVVHAKLVKSDEK